MNKQSLSVFAIIMLIAFSFSCCSQKTQRHTRSSAAAADTININTYVDNDTIAMYMSVIPPRVKAPKYEPYFVDGDTLDVYRDITTNSDKMPLYYLSATLPQHALLQRLTDGYNAARILMSVYADVQIYERFGDGMPSVGACIDKLNCAVIHKAATRAKAQKYKAVNVKLVSTSHDNLADDYYDVFDESTHTFVTFLMENYLSDGDDAPSQEEIDKVRNPNNYLADWDTLSEKIKDGYLDMRARVTLRKELAQRYDKAETFHQKCLLARQITQLDEKYGENDAEDRQTGLALLEELLVAKEYSPFLYDVFGDWRCLQQVIAGFSNDSAIPNYYYNLYRREAFDTMIRYIALHPDDRVAIDLAILFSYYDDIYRYYPSRGMSIGNGNLGEHQSRFGE